ncbi:glycosyltransferase family 10 [bacterium]|nr:glycosyltransferase family 10 [bacterium]
MKGTIKIFIEDNTFAHCKFSSPSDSTNFEDPIIWDRSGSYVTDDLVVYTDNLLDKVDQRQDGSGKNIAWLVESPGIIPYQTKWLYNNGDKFDAIWTHDESILNKWDHAKLLPIGGCWLLDECKNIHSKSKDFSIIASTKRELPGHKIRHAVIAGGGNKIDVWGGCKNRHIDNKFIGLKDYRYHFAIENVISGYYFSEKLIDTFMTGCIPIYWGTKYIDQFFNTDGMIIFNELKELPALLKQCTPEFYDSKLDIIKENFELAKKYRLAEDRIPELL